MMCTGKYVHKGKRPTTIILVFGSAGGNTDRFRLIPMHAYYYVCMYIHVEI